MISFTAEQRFVVTGASSGIGEGVALLLNELGATVIGIGRNQERLEGMKAKAKHPENVFLEQKDLAEDIAGLPAYVKELKEKYGKFSGMAYCAGVSSIVPIRMFEYETAKRMFDINYHAPMFMTKGMVDRRNNIGRGCSLVYISSIDAVTCSKGQPLYSGSKAALAASVKAISKEVSPAGIRMNSILPAMIKTPMTLNPALSDTLGRRESDESATYPFGWGEVNDLASFVVYLLSDCAKFITGQRYVYDSGENY
jgi:NAD(P)-dependent dehydrogenase (short-subunit alcohol dehydrogenase family)